MSTFWRIALAWMLALALPLQGHAAQRTLACATTHLPATVRAVAGLQPAAAVPTHHHALHVQATQGGAQGQPASHAWGPSTHADSCSACASCCHAAALPPSILQLASLHPELPETPFEQRVLPRVWPDGLERPPRSSRP